MYVAEIKDKKGLSFYSSEDGAKGTAFAHRDDYGEQMSGATAPQVTQLLACSFIDTERSSLMPPLPSLAVVQVLHCRRQELPRAAA